MNITKSQSIAITWLRVFAMMSIVMCHILQTYGNKWAWVLNIGVQVFLAISGYLYGLKNIIDWKLWFYKRFNKLYIPYIIFVIISFILYHFFANGLFTIKSLLCYLVDIQWFRGGGKRPRSFMVYDSNSPLLSNNAFVTAI